MAMIYLSVAILGDIVATLALNEARGLTRLAPILVCIAGYAVSVTFLSLTLQTIPVQLAYAVWSCSGIVLLATVRWVWFDQPLDWQGIVGIKCIVGGIFILKMSVDPQTLRIRNDRHDNSRSSGSRSALHPVALWATGFRQWGCG